jgi:hypothetical protein
MLREVDRYSDPDPDRPTLATHRLKFRTPYPTYGSFRELDIWRTDGLDRLGVRSAVSIDGDGQQNSTVDAVGACLGRVL